MTNGTIDQNVSYHYLRVGNYSVKLKAIANVSGNISANFTKNVTVNYPNYYPRILPAYTIHEFDDDPAFHDFMNDSANVKVVALPAFDYLNGPIHSWNGPNSINHTLIDYLHSKGLLAYMGIARWRGVGGWDNWTNIEERLPYYIEAGIDGIGFDEYYLNETCCDYIVLGAQYQELMDELKTINPNFRTSMTQVYVAGAAYAIDLNKSLAAGARPDYIAAEWYLNPGDYELLKAVAEEYGIRSAYWVDYRTYNYAQQTYDEMDAVFLWSLCWAPGVCGSDYLYRSFVPWNVTKSYVENLGPGLE
jgi:hypothetical protein